MNQPLGRAIGNSLEVKECIDILRGETKDGARPVLDLSMELSAHMLVLSEVDKSLEAARQRLQRALDSGDALERFRKNVEAQGGDPRVADEPGKVLPLVSEAFKVESPRSGYITRVEAAEIGHAIAALGGGRVRIEDRIDPAVGFVADVRIGDEVSKGQSLGTIYTRDQSKAEEAAKRIKSAYVIGDNPSGEPPTLIKEVIDK